MNQTKQIIQTQELYIADCFPDRKQSKRYFEKLDKALKEFKLKYPKEQKIIDKAKKIEYGTNNINTPINPNSLIIETTDKNTAKVWDKFVEFIEKVV